MVMNNYITRPVDPSARHGAEISKFFAVEQYTISIRHLILLSDLIPIFDWLTPRLSSSLWKNESPKSELLKSYEDSLLSENQQSFMVEIRTNRTSRQIGQIDIEALADNKSIEGWHPVAGDYLVKMLISPDLRRFMNAFVNLLRTFIEYAFQFPGVARLVTHLDVEYQQANDLLIVAGFERVGKEQLADYVVNAYSCTRASLQGRGYQISNGDQEDQEE